MPVSSRVTPERSPPTSRVMAVSSCCRPLQAENTELVVVTGEQDDRRDGDQRGGWVTPLLVDTDDDGRPELVLPIRVDRHHLPGYGHQLLDRTTSKAGYFRQGDHG
ncbi:MAG: hypothetical protein R2706_19105 [Acidimicrobiales bacterium]